MWEAKKGAAELPAGVCVDKAAFGVSRRLAVHADAGIEEMNCQHQHGPTVTGSGLSTSAVGVARGPLPHPEHSREIYLLHWELPFKCSRLCSGGRG